MKPTCPFVLFIILLALSSCAGDEPVAPLPHAWNLVGQVTRPDGSPIVGAFVNVAYTAIVNGDTMWSPDASPTLLPAALIAPDSFHVDVYDHLNHLVWNLKGIANQATHWPGTDLSGRPVPDGPYRFDLTGFYPDTMLTWERWLIVARPLESRALVSDVVTNSMGLFSIRVDRLPIWDTYSSDETILAFGPEVVLYAFRGDGSPQFAKVTINVLTPLNHLLTLEIPN